MNELFNVLHVVTAVFIVGPLAILPMTALRALRSGNGAQVATLATSTSIFGRLSILVVLLGFAVMGTSDPKYGLTFLTPWILWSLILWVAAAVVSEAVVVPSMRKAAAALGATAGSGTSGTSGTSDASGASQYYGRIAGGSGVVSILLLVVVVLMVWKP
ncbi:MULTISPECIES: DUF2269 family protein [unclassified Leifsonia]|uniref:DUF2269 family protein n=1 Tax=unclassified Leifsonia TaxID=2663824 RepID=UPI0006F3E6F4|nr:MULTISPECIES: DUF2269 family protein [unclassified Leifsonia]KQX06341.1 conjugal transfer protein TrbL [Leifsonia sp. Root1293]KRA10625.1 conjugal transfer protein TrbL [Leifsonia sp. Root60]